LFAACLEHVFLDPVIILIETAPRMQHALIGCWRSESLLQQPLVRNGSQVKQWMDAGELILLDSIGFAYGKSAEQTFLKCRNKGRAYLNKACDGQNGYRFLSALDVIAARYNNKIMPMPFGKGLQYDRTASLALFRARREAEELHSPARGARHLLLGLLSLENGLMRQVCKDLADKLAERTRKSLSPLKRTRRTSLMTEDWKAVMRRVEENAARSSRMLVTEAELATALLETPSKVENMLARVGLSGQQCLEELRILLGESGIPSVIPSEWQSSGFTI
jgi:hypothetical protein